MSLFITAEASLQVIPLFCCYSAEVEVEMGGEEQYIVERKTLSILQEQLICQWWTGTETATSIEYAMQLNTLH